MDRWPAFVAAPIAVFAPAAHAMVYLTTEQAQQAIFPGATFSEVRLPAGAAQKGSAARSRGPRIWRASGGGWFLLDWVLGKHEYITFAVGLNSDGSVRGIEILDYREAYGYQVREASWRRQFVGKTAADPLELERDILNLSGATLSCRHVTEGVKRLLALYAEALR